MKQIKSLIITALLFVSVQAFSQSLLVYHVVGKVTYTANGSSKPLVMNTTVSASTSINVPYGGKIELLNESSKQRITIKNPGQGSIAQLSKASGNSISELSEKYVAYVKKQLTNKGLTSQQRYTDFATVTREIDSVEVAPKTPQNPLAARFGKFKKQTEKKFQSFRQECNKKYTDFVRQAWEKMGAEPPVARPSEPEVKPVVLEDTTSTARFLIFGRKKKDAEVADIKAPAKRNKRPQPVEEVKQVAVSAADAEFGEMPFMFFGNELSVRLDETKRINIGKINPDRIADLLMHLSGPTYDNLLYDCLKLRSEHKLCDWAYLLMLKEIADQFCGADSNEAVLLLGYLYYQSGYKVRFASDEDNRLYLLIASDHMIYGKAAYTLDGEKFYPMQEVNTGLFICRAKFPQESTLSLRIEEPIQFDVTETESRTITSKAYPEIKVDVSVNRSLMDFYSSYPSSYYNNDQFTRWAIYAETPMNQEIKTQLYPALKTHLEGLSELEAVNRLLNFVQTGLEYAYDEDVWGGDRAFFAEETLYYPFCDCEDRSILLTRLVRDLLGLECVLIYYPGHLASAVHFTEDVDGDYYSLNGKDYTVCDPTYINAPVGMQMSSFAGGGATLIPIK